MREISSIEPVEPCDVTGFGEQRGMRQEISRERHGAGDTIRTLVVDDDPAMLRMITTYLRDNNIEVTAAASRQVAEQHLSREEFSLVILDLRLGKDDGLDLLRNTRSRSDVPIIIITGHRHEEIDRVVGLELGADDYMTKPFGLRELLARVRAVLRRHETSHKASACNGASGGFRFGGWLLDRRSQRLTDNDGNVVELTKGAYALLVAFLEAPHRALSRDHLLQATRVHEDIFDRSIDVQILRLRRKLETVPASPRIIQTKRGVGYVFTLHVEKVERSEVASRDR